MSLPFPNVPKLPGIPPVPRLPGFNYAQNLVLGSNALENQLWQAFLAPPAWGIFDANGNQIVTPDSVIDFGNRNEWEVSSFPVQAGGFASYNKVVVPFEISVRMTKGGSQSDRQTFLAQIGSIAGTTNLYTILTPEQSYANCTVTRFEVVRRGAAGAFFLDIDIYFVAVNQVTAQYTSATANAQDPTAQPFTGQGTVQLQPIDPQAALAAAPAVSFY